MQPGNGPHTRTVRVGRSGLPPLFAFLTAVINDADTVFPGEPGIRHEKAQHAARPGWYGYVFHFTRAPEDQDGDGTVYRYTGYTLRPRP